MTNEVTTDIAALQAQNAALLAQVADLENNLAEMAHEFEVTVNENITMGQVFDSDDRLATAVTQLKKAAELDRVLQTRMFGLMNEKNQMIRVAKGWQRKAQRAERELDALRKQMQPTV